VLAENASANRLHQKKLRSYAARGPTMRAEVAQMNGTNQLSGTTGAGRKHMHGGAWYDDLWSGVKSVGSAVLPIAAEIAPMLLRRGGALQLAGRGLSMAGAGQAYDHVSPNHLHHAKVTHRARPPRMIGHGSLSRTCRGT
jgi:hypothetical protein